MNFISKLFKKKEEETEVVSKRLRRGVRYADPRVLPGGNGCAVRYHQPQYIERYGVVQTDA